jgi:hypothetical protein
MGQDMIGFLLQPAYGKKISARMLQDDSINRDLNVVISQGQWNVEKNRHLVEDGKEHGEGSSQGEVDASEKENPFPMAGYPLHSTPARMAEKQFSGEIPR